MPHSIRQAERPLDSIWRGPPGSARPNASGIERQRKIVRKTGLARNIFPQSDSTSDLEPAKVHPYHDVRVATPGAKDFVHRVRVALRRPCLIELAPERDASFEQPIVALIMIIDPEAVRLLFTNDSLVCKPGPRPKRIERPICVFVVLDHHRIAP
jgi:hypothetical protein